MDDDELLESIQRDLMALIQDEGLTPTRLEAHAPNIIQLFGFRAASDVEAQVRIAISEMPEDKYTWSLSFALGVETVMEEHFGRLTDRRKSLKDSDGFKVSEDTLRRWERKAMRTLARHIVARARQLDEEENGTPSFTSPESSELLLVCLEKMDKLQERVSSLELRLRSLEATKPST